MGMALTDRVAARYLLSREFATPEALKEYLRKHPKSDPRKHTVKKPKSEGKPESKVKPSDGLEALKGLSSDDRKRVLERALEMNESGGKSEEGKDHSKEKGFEVLKGLSPAKQKRIIERALKGE